MLRLASVLASFAMLALSSSAQVVHVVDAAGGPGSTYMNPFFAIQDAADGDTVLVRSGAYGWPGAAVVDGKSLVLAADDGASVTISGNLLIQNLSAGQCAVVSGVTFDKFTSVSFSAPIPEVPVEIVSCAGPVVLQDCTINPVVGRGCCFPGGEFGVLGGMVRASSSSCVVIDRCTLVPTTPFDYMLGGTDLSPTAHAALHGIQSGLYVHDSVLRGVDGVSSISVFIPLTINNDGGEGLRVEGGRAFVSGSTLMGGQGGDTIGPGGASSNLDGGDGLLALSGADVTLRDSTLAAGSASAGSPGLPSKLTGTSSLTLEAGTHRRLVGPPVLRTGDSASYGLFGVPGDFYIVLVGTDVQAVDLAGVGGIQHFGPTAVPLTTGIMPASGAVRVGETAPDLGTTAGVPLLVQAVFRSLVEANTLSDIQTTVVLPAGTP